MQKTGQEAERDRDLFHLTGKQSKKQPWGKQTSLKKKKKKQKQKKNKKKTTEIRGIRY